MPEVRITSCSFSALRRAGVSQLGQAWLGVIAAALILSAMPAFAEVTTERAKALAHMVTQDCGSCHGLTMKGGLGRPLTPDALANAEPEGLALIILDGVPGTAMPPWRPLLTEEEALWIARHLKERN